MDSRATEEKERAEAQRRREKAIARARSHRIVSVPRARIGKPVYQQDRGGYAAVILAESRRAFDLALTGALGLPPPEKAPPARTKAD